MRKKRSVIWSISKNELTDLIERSKNFKEVLHYFGMKYNAGNYRTLVTRLKFEGIKWDHISNYRFQCLKENSQKAKQNISTILVENSTFSRTVLKIRLVKENLLEYKCSECGLTNSWNNKSLSLQLDHKNGVSNDNRLDNLRFLCPNCHSQTNTFSGRKHKKDKKLNKTKKCLFCNQPCLNKYCSYKCSKLASRKVKRPTKDQLEEDIKNMSMLAIGKKYGVSDNCVRKWIKQYNKVTAGN